MSNHQDLFWRDYSHHLSDREEDRLSEQEKGQLEELTAKLRQQNPTKIGGYAVYSFESCFSADLVGYYTFHDTREAAQKAATEWKNRPDYEATVVGVHGTETVSHHARISPVTAAAMEEIKQGKLKLDAPLSCKIDGENALCVEYEHGLNLRSLDYPAQPPLGLPSGTKGDQTVPPISAEGRATMSDDVEQTPSNWTDRGGMVPQQESANDWAKEIAEAAYERSQAGNEKAQEKGMER
jgi:hypothetical protein